MIKIEEEEESIEKKKREEVQNLVCVVMELLEINQLVTNPPRFCRLAYIMLNAQ